MAVLGAIKREMTLARPSEHFGVHPKQITAGMLCFRKVLPNSEMGNCGGPLLPAVNVKSLPATIAELTLEDPNCEQF
jgi:hypothetical protein